MGLITDEFLRDLITTGECTKQEISHWEDMGWLVRGKTEYFIDCDEFGGKTMTEKAQEGLFKDVIQILMIEIKQRKIDYRKWKKANAK